MDRYERYAVWDYFDFATDNFIDIVMDTIERIDDYSDYDEINQCIDDSLIFTWKQWEIMKHYQSPEKADFYTAIDEFASDIQSICNILSKMEDEKGA